MLAANTHTPPITTPLLTPRPLANLATWLAVDTVEVQALIPNYSCPDQIMTPIGH